MLFQEYIVISIEYLQLVCFLFQAFFNLLAITLAFRVHSFEVRDLFLQLAILKIYLAQLPTEVSLLFIKLGHYFKIVLNDSLLVLQPRQSKPQIIALIPKLIIFGLQVLND